MRDIIYRQDAINALKAMAAPLLLDRECKDIWERDRTLDNAIDAIRGLSSAQPLDVQLAYHKGGCRCSKELISQTGIIPI